MTAYWVWRRELAVTLRAPIVYVIGGLFLVVQGIAFAGLVVALSDPRRPAPLGALLENQLAGTLLTWVLQLVVLTLLGMRAIADERRAGGWELLLTAGVGEGAAVVGKWLAAATVYALLWLPTLAYFAVVAIFRTDPGGWDIATIACGYAGAIALGAALLAWAIAASAATRSTLAAGGLGFALLVGMFLVGELPSLGAAHWLAGTSVRAQLAGFARGEISLEAIAFVVGLAATGISLAIALAAIDRRRDARRRVLATVLVAAIAILANIAAAQHPHAIDLSAARRNTLDAETRDVLDELPHPATLMIISPTLGALDDLYAEVGRVADRMAAAGPVTVRRVDPAALPGGLTAAARLAGVQPDELAENGGVVVDVGDRKRVIDILQLATIDRDAGGAPQFERLAIEQAITGALAELSTATPLTVCATTGHDELSMTVASKTGADWTLVANRLAAAGITVRDATSLDGCAAVIVAGPTQPLSPDEALALQSYVAHGGGLVVAAASRPVPNGPQLAPTGLEPVLANAGISLPLAIAVDPSLAIREVPGALLIVDGYARPAGARSAAERSAAEIDAGFANARRTLWFQPRVVVATGAARALVSASAQSWGERDLEHGPPTKDADDLAGPVALAAVSGRIVAIGSAESFTTAALASGASAGDLWLEQAVRFAAGQAPRATANGHAPAHVRLVMTAAERRTVIALCVAGIPLAWLFVGGAIVLLRRRRQ
jgi:ABC-2 type transport system permease protein